MELCVGGESILAADTHMGMSRAVRHGQTGVVQPRSFDQKHTALEQGLGYVCPLEKPRIKTCAATCGYTPPSSTLHAHGHMGPFKYRSFSVIHLTEKGL